MRTIIKALMGLSLLGTATVASAASIQIDPATQTVGVGDGVNISINAVAFPDTFGGAVRVSWDPTKLSLLTDPSAVAAELLAPAPGRGAWELQSVALDSVINPSRIDATMSCFLGCLSYAGDFNLFTLSFQALDVAASTAITLGPKLLNGSPVDPFIDPLTGQPLTYDLLGATVTINAAAGTVPLPGAVWLFLSGAIGMVGAGRRRRAA